MNRKEQLIADIQNLLNSYEGIHKTSINPSLLEFMDENTLISIIDSLLSQKEDAKVANELLSSTFKNFFSDVKSCFNGREALEAYLKYAPDVVFVDIIMSEMDGIELSRKIREIDPN